jgi:hypothetical protein
MLISKISLSILFAAGLCNARRGTAATHLEIQKLLSDFRSNPVEAMDAPLLRKNSRGDILPPKAIPPNLVEQKDNVRKQLKLQRNGQSFRLSQWSPSRAPILQDDDPRTLIDPTSDNLVLNTLSDMDKQGLFKGASQVNPWADSYWPTYAGYSSARYADERFTSVPQGHYDQYLKVVLDPATRFSTIFQEIYQRGQSRYPLGQLSPAEKYDLLVGDYSANLTAFNWNEAANYRKQNGLVDTWMGLCHGWAAASIHESRPSTMIEVLSFDGRTRIPFYPSDIKALATTLWARANVPSNFVGGRCDEKAPAKDPQSGRILSQKCFDTNPGTFHIAMINQVGRNQRSLVIDATYDYEVWNQPISSYEYKYFNPITRQPVATLEEAIVDRQNFEKDIFASYRSSQSRSIVGIAMDVSYVVESTPSLSPTDSVKDDPITTVTYLYDLELDEHGAILGGEWYSNKHPDFLWVHPQGSRATTFVDAGLRSGWAVGYPMNSEWMNAAKALSKRGLPLESVVRQLIQASRSQR